MSTTRGLGVTKRLWIFQKDTLEEGFEGSPVFFFFDEKLELGRGQIRDFERRIFGSSTYVSEVEIHDFYIELRLADFDVNSVAKRVAETLAAYLKWSQLPRQAHLSKEELIELRNRMRFDRKWNVKL